MTAVAAELQFHAPTHIYRLNGQVLPGVTQVLEGAAARGSRPVPGIRFYSEPVARAGRG
jgi:hypothetical protein